MHEIKLVLTDIDGTILPYGCDQVPTSTREAMRELIDAGIATGPCTGRSRPWATRYLADDKSLTSTCVGTNGNEVYLNDAVLRRAQMPAELIARVAQVTGEQEGAGTFWIDGDDVYQASGSREDLSACSAAYGKAAKPGLILPEAPVVKLNVFVNGSLERTREVADLLNATFPELDFDVPQPMLLNGMPTGWGKGSGVRVLAEALGCTMDQVVVFGDADNDLSMLEAVPNSVAVAGATPAAASAARWHIGACEDGAVADAMRALAAGQWPFEG